MSTPRRSIFLGGLRLVFKHPGAVVWTYAASLALALAYSLGLHAQLSGLLDHSLAAQRLNSAFDLGTLAALLFRLNNHVPSSGVGHYAGLPLYFLFYFVIVPGTLCSYRLDAPGSLASLLSSGLGFFWRFVRITLLTLIVSGLILGPLFAVQNAWSEHVEEHVVGRSAFLHNLAGLAVILLVAAFLRLYFDLVEVYTIQLGARCLPNGKPDRRVRKVLLPALRTLWRSLPRTLGAFLFIGVLGIAALAATGSLAVQSLAQPRAWPQFLLLQVGFFLNLAARFWQRGAETVLAEEYPLPVEVSLGGDSILPDPAPLSGEFAPAVEAERAMGSPLEGVEQPPTE